MDATPPQDTLAGRAAEGARLLAQHSDSPGLDAELLLGHVLGLSRTGLIVRGEVPMPADRLHAYHDLLARRRAGVPVAYLTGTREFWSLALCVSPAVLVPRPETELLVEQALARLPQGTCRVLDLGTGSGAIALAIASERPHAEVTGVDLSPAALEVAAANAVALKLSRIEWRQGSWLAAVTHRRFDLIVANPPYVAADDPALARLSAEPALALTPGPTGLEAFAAIVTAAPAHLEDGGGLIFEHGAAQAAAVAGLLERRGFARIRSYSDLSGRPRVTSATLFTHQ